MNNGFKFGMIAFIVLMFACCGGFMFVLSPITATINKKEKEAKDYGDTYTKQILKTYSANSLLSLSTQQYKESFKVEEFQKTLKGNEKALGQYVSGKGRATLIAGERKGTESIIRANYENKGNFEKGKAIVKIKLLYQNKKWYIEQFSIEPA